MKTKTQQMLLASMFSALTAIGAFIKIPMPPYPVPMTLQTMFVFLSGLLLPARTAFYSQLVYVLLGLIGIPIFTNGGGIAYLLDPTFGYLLAFLACAPLMSKLAEQTLYKGRRVAFSAGCLAIILGVQVLGVAYMSLVYSQHLASPLSFSKVFYIATIFIPLDVIKLFVATILALRLRKSAPAIFSPSTALPK
ncbi:biotin transporter BioY [Eubacteriales bacterium OttesenSCG-928-K08]|nr:biotin transporter BioY [Eubacteriales bacterium OttesenSCG-928-K08]